MEHTTLHPEIKCILTLNAVRSWYLTVNFREMTHERHPIVCGWGRGTGLLWVGSLTKVYFWIYCAVWNFMIFCYDVPRVVFMCISIHGWLDVRLCYLQCISNRDNTVLNYVINMEHIVTVKGRTSIHTWGALSLNICTSSYRSEAL